jgi:hypothetical protein
VVKSLPLTANGMINGTLIKFFYSVEIFSVDILINSTKLEYNVSRFARLLSTKITIKTKT